MSWARQIHIKSAAELQIMREAGRINASVLAAVKERITPGVSTADLNAAAEEVLRNTDVYHPSRDTATHRSRLQSPQVSIGNLSMEYRARHANLRLVTSFQLIAGQFLKVWWLIQHLRPE